MAQTILLLHGFTGNAGVWDEVRAEFDSDAQILSPNLPGHGAVKSDPATFGFAPVCSWLRDVLRDTGMTKSVVWGYSMGGRIALHFALACPEYVDRLILESTSPGIADSAERESRLRQDVALATRIEEEGIEWFVDYWVNQPLFATLKSLPKDRQDRGRELRLQNSASGLAAALRSFSVGKQEPLHNRLRELTMPVLVMAGADDRKYCEIGEAMAHSIPNAQFRIIPGAGHAPHWERSNETAGAVRQFLRRTVERSA